MMSRTIARKSFLILAIALCVEALVCTQIPLLNYLGFEFSFLNALVAGFLCGLFAISQWKNLKPSTDHEYWNYVQSTLGASLVAILVPLLVISTNAAFVKNCSFTLGFRLYILYVVPSVVFCVSLATVSSVAAHKYKRFLFTFLCLCILGHILYVTLTRPQIFAFNPIAGYFPGFTYDETLGGEVRLLVYRVSTIAASAVMFTLAVVMLKFFASSFERSQSIKRSLHYVAALVVSFAVCIGLYRMSDELGLSSSAGFITKQLGGVRYTQHFKIIYPQKSVTATRLRRIILLHEYLYDQLSEEWHVSPRRPITVFIYGSAGQKEKLIGAAATDFTKPWLRQVNINLEDLGGALKHELVHVMLAEEGLPFLGIAPNAGLIEGAAVATQRFEYDESLHQLAAQILALGIQPDVAKMFSVSGFFQSYPGVSYVLAGSFCRYLIDRYGVGRFKELYGTGHYRPEYRKDLDSLVADWKSMLRSIPLSQQELAKAAYLFKRQPIYGRECVRVIANLNADTRKLIGQKKYEAALASAEWSLSLTRSVDAVFQKSFALLRLGHYEQSVDFVEHELADTSVRASLLPLRITLGDAYWALDNFKEATRQFSLVLDDSLNTSINEAMAIRLEILSRAASRTEFKPFFLSDLNDSASVAFLEKLKDNPALDPLARYLLGREYAVEGKDNQVVRELRDLAPLESSILEYLRNSRIASAMYDLGDYERAKLYSWRALNHVSNDAQLYQLEDFLLRCTWIQDHLR